MALFRRKADPMSVVLAFVDAAVAGDDVRLRAAYSQIEQIGTEGVISGHAAFGNLLARGLTAANEAVIRRRFSESDADLLVVRQAVADLGPVLLIRPDPDGRATLAVIQKHSGAIAQSGATWDKVAEEITWCLVKIVRELDIKLNFA